MPDLQRGRQLLTEFIISSGFLLGANRLFSHIQRPSHLRETLQGNDWYLIQSNDKTQREALLKKLTFDEREKSFQEIAPTCSECGSIVAGQVFTFNGRVLCENDFMVVEAFFAQF